MPTAQVNINLSFEAHRTNVEIQYPYQLDPIPSLMVVLIFQSALSFDFNHTQMLSMDEKGFKMIISV